MLYNFFGLRFDLQIFAQSVCKTRLKKLAKDKHSGLKLKFINYGQKSFITLDPGHPYRIFINKLKNYKTYF
jgi:hypothetical protein